MKRKKQRLSVSLVCVLIRGIGDFSSLANAVYRMYRFHRRPKPFIRSRFDIDHVVSARTKKCIPLNESQTMQKDRLTAIVPLMIIKWKKNVCADPGFIDNGTHGWCGSAQRRIFIFPCETHITIPLCWAWIMRAIEEKFLNCITPSAAVE